MIEQMAACNQEQQHERLALATSTSVMVDINVLSCRQRVARVNARSTCICISARTLRHDSAAVESLAARAYHTTRLGSNDQAAVLASGTVG